MESLYVESIQKALILIRELLSNDNVKLAVKERLQLLPSNTINYIKYTILHKNAINDLAFRYFSVLGDLNFDEHDRDKLVYYFVLNNVILSDKIHKKTVKHHQVPQIDYIKYEVLLDYESAHMTKFDKPLSAYDTILKYHSEYLDLLETQMRSLDIWDKRSPYTITETEMYNMFDTVLADDIITELIKSFEFVISESFWNYLNDDYSKCVRCNDSSTVKLSAF